VHGVRVVGVAYDTTAPGPGSGRAGGGGRCEERGSGVLALLPGSGAAQPISSSDLPFVSLTNFRTNGMESAAKTV
jgi:hypothetical protein